MTTENLLEIILKPLHLCFQFYFSVRQQFVLLLGTIKHSTQKHSFGHNFVMKMLHKLPCKQNLQL